MGHLPHVTIGVGEGARVAAPVGACGRTGDRRAGAFGLGQNGVNFLGRPDIMRQFYPGRAVTTERGPQAEDHAAGLEKRDLVIRLLSAPPAECLVEGSGAGQVLYAEGHQADPLFHGAKYGAPLGGRRMPTRAITMGEADDIRELAERLLTPGRAVPTVTLLPGRGPDDPDLSVPSPPGARLIGSLIREPGWQMPRDIEVVVDAPGSEDRIVQFYEEQFGKRGWRSAPQFGHHRGGFMAGPEGEGRMFRRGEDGLTILLTARPVKAGWVEVRLRTRWIPADTEIHQPPPGHDLIPALHQPAGVQVMTPRGGGGGSGHWTSEAAVETPKTVTELEADFASQLQKAGWKKMVGGAGGRVAWSSWAVPGKGEWYGYLFVVEAPGENRRSLWVQIESARDRYGGGWHTATSALSSG